jgi:hypothetical protein
MCYVQANRATHTEEEMSCGPKSATPDTPDSLLAEMYSCGMISSEIYHTYAGQESQVRCDCHHLPGQGTLTHCPTQYVVPEHVLYTQGVISRVKAVGADRSRAAHGACRACPKPDVSTSQLSMHLCMGLT